MSKPNIMRRASQRCLKSLRRSLSRDNTHPDDKSSISRRSSESRSSYSASSLFTTKTVEEDDEMVDEEPIPECPEADASPHHQGQSPFFRRLPPEIREQIYSEFWVAAGVNRHAFLVDKKLTYSPCVTDHEAPDERQIGVASDFKKSKRNACVQSHPEWFNRMTSTWCNHWRCERLWEDIQNGRAVDGNKTQDYMSLLLSCKRMYKESIGSFQESKTLTITDGQTLQKVLRWPRPAYFPEARRINLSLREDTGNYLYLNGAAIWHLLSEPELKLRRVYLWLDAECPLTRRLLTEFRELYTGIPGALAGRLTIDFPCDAEDGFWAWGEVEMEMDNGAVRTLEPIVPEFTVVARGRQRFNVTAGGYISNVDKGRPRRKVLKASNPFEDILLYGRGFHDNSYI